MDPTLVRTIKINHKEMMNTFLQILQHITTLSFIFFYSCCFASDSSEDPWYFEPNQVVECWKITKGKGVVVDVLDSKVKFISILKGKEYFPTGQTYSTSISSKKNSPDLFLHGTAMAGLIAGDRDKLVCKRDESYCDKDGKIIVAGIAPEAKIISRFSIGQRKKALLESINETIPDNIHGQSCRKVIRETKLILLNLSGGYQEKSNNEADDIKELIKRKVSVENNRYFLIIASVGNEGVELTKANIETAGVVPARLHFKLMDPMIRVGAIKKYSTKEQPQMYEGWGRGSNYGKEYVDIVAPGHIIPILTPSAEAKIANGTSEATAIVSGAAALLSSCNPFADADNIKQALLNNSDKSRNLEDKVKDGRVLNIYGAVNNYCRTKKISTQTIKIDLHGNSIGTQ